MAKKSILQNSDVRWNRREGRPRKIRGEFELPSARTTEDAILAFLRQNADELHLWIGDEDLKVIQDISTPLRRIIRYQQLHDGIPIFRSLVMVQIDKEDRVRQIDLGHEPRVRVVPPAADKKITRRTALKVASNSLGDFELRQEPPKPEIVYYPTPEGLRLAYLVLIPTREPLHDWRIIVDAYSGEILEKEDLIVYSEEIGEGLVFDPNPVVTALDATLRDPNATQGSCGFTGSDILTIDDERETGWLLGIKESGGTYELDGPYVKLVNFWPPDITPPSETSKDGFRYSSTDDGFEAVMVYYHVDTIQRYIQDRLKISNAHDKQIEADAHDNDGDGNGAFFSPFDRGIHFGDSEDCRPNRAQDADCILHEYGHAIQEDQVPGWGQLNAETNRYETDAMGEGFCDILACVYLAPKHHDFQREVFEDWIFADRGGLRRVDGTRVYPTDWADWILHPTTGEVVKWEHANGQIWSAALWNIYRAIGGDSLDVGERRAARDILLETVIRGHFRLAPDATMPEGAEAVMEIDEDPDKYRGRHLMEMLDSFHDRGLLDCNPNADLHIRTAVDDDGTTPYTGEQYWNSPDVWIRNADDNGTTHQEPICGRDNWFYARVWNRGTEEARAFVVTFNVLTSLYVGGFVYPQHFAPVGPNGRTYVSAGVGFNLQPGRSTIVKARWPAALVPSPYYQPSVLASVYTPTDVPPSGSHVWEHNNLARKSVTTLFVEQTQPFVEMPLPEIQNFYPYPEHFWIEILRSWAWWNIPVYMVDPLSVSPSGASTGSDGGIMRKLFYSVEELGIVDTVPVEQPTPVLRFLEPTQVEIAHRGLGVEPVRLQLGRDSTLDIGSRTAGLRPAHPGFGVEGRQASLVTDKTGVTAIKFHPGRLTGFPVALKPRSRVRAGLRIEVPAHAKPGDVIELDLMLRNQQGQVVGGRKVLVNVV